MTSARAHTARGLVGNSFALLATTYITALLGYVFWMLSARGFSSGVIGVTNTVISAMTLVAVITASGFVPMLTRLLPGASPQQRSGLFSTAFVVSGLLSGLAGAGAGLLMPQRIQAEVGTGWLVVLLSTGSIGTALVLVVNAALLGVRRAELSLLGGIAGSISRLVSVVAVLTVGFLAVGGDRGASRSILTIWVASLAITLVLSVWLLARATPSFRFHPRRFWFSEVWRSIGWDHVATLAYRAPALAIPILAAAVFPPSEIGALAVVLLILGAFLAVSASVSNSLLADCSDDPGRLQAQARRASRMIGLMLIAPVAVACLLAKEVLGFFGPDYTASSTLLILLLLSTFPDAVINVAIATMRVQQRFAIVAGLTVAGAIMSIGGAWILMSRLGIYGAGIAVIVSQVIIAIAFAVSGTYRLHVAVPIVASGPLKNGHE